jgi:hypothetical protein
VSTCVLNLCAQYLKNTGALKKPSSILFVNTCTRMQSLSKDIDPACAMQMNVLIDVALGINTWHYKDMVL